MDIYKTDTKGKMVSEIKNYLYNKFSKLKIPKDNIDKNEIVDFYGKKIAIGTNKCLNTLFYDLGNAQGKIDNNPPHHLNSENKIENHNVTQIGLLFGFIYYTL